MAAEHEFNILPALESYISCWPKAKTVIHDVRTNRTQHMAHISLTSWSLMKELVNLNLTHEINSNIFMDTELLRGFISGFYDGDGGISGNNISLTFGVQYDFEPMIKDMQIALKQCKSFLTVICSANCCFLLFIKPTTSANLWLSARKIVNL